MEVGEWVVEAKVKFNEVEHSYEWLIQVLKADIQIVLESSNTVWVGEDIKIDASNSYDPEKHKLDFNWSCTS